MPRNTEPMTKVWLSVARWKAIQELARREDRSAAAELGRIVDRGMGGRAGYELAVMSEKRAERLMSGD